MWLVGEHEDASTCREWMTRARPRRPTCAVAAAAAGHARCAGHYAAALLAAGDADDFGEGLDEDFVPMKMVESYFEIVRKTIGDGLKSV